MAPTPPFSRRALLAAAAVGSVLLGTAGIAAAQSDPSTDAPAVTAPSDQARPPRADETPLAGDDASKAEAAALAAVPGATVDRLETDGDGATYEAHLTKADGTHVTVKMDGDFKVTSVDEGGPGGAGGPGHCDHDGRRGPGGPPPTGGTDPAPAAQA